MWLVAVVALLPADLVQTLVAQAAPRSSPNVRFELRRIVGREAALGKVFGGALGPDGSLHVLDPTTSEVIRFDPTGTILARFGRKGGGPGEFMLPYRIAVGPDGTIHVFDFASSELSHFDSSGHFRSRHRTPFLLSQVDRIEVLPGKQVAFSGIASGYRPAEQSGVHVFDDTLAYIGSFGPVPQARDKAVLLYWGAGGISLTSQQEILYARRIPYEIYIYTARGSEVGRLVPGITLKGLPDDAFSLSGDERSSSIAASGVPVERPFTAFELSDDLILAGRSALGNRPAKWDILSRRTGRLLQSLDAPPGARGVLAFDRKRGLLWVTGEVDLEPVILQYHVEFGA